MTINTSTNRTVATGNGATTIWNYNFLIPTATDVVVQITDKTTGVVTTLTPLQYSISGLDNALGGTVTYTPALTTNQTITIQRIVPVIQDTSLSNQGAFYPVVVENALDYLTMIAQQLSDSITRAIQISPNGTNTIDAQSNRIINVGAPVATTDAARIGDVQAAQAVANAVPTPILADVGRFLRATGVGAYAWTTFVGSMITDATAAGLALLTGANAAAQRTSLGLGTLATLSSVTNTELASNAVAATNVQANVLTFAKFQRTGTVGQVWASAGAGADPQYLGSMTLLASGTAAAVATLDLTLPSGYKWFKLYINDYNPVTNGARLCTRYSYDSGSTYLSTGTYGETYLYASTASAGSTASSQNTSITYNQLTFSLDNSLGQKYGGLSVDLFPGNTNSVALQLLNRLEYSGGIIYTASGTNWQTTNGRATNIRLLMSSGNISTLTYALYGVI